MSLKCKKCGCDALIKSDDWYSCPKCGAVMFDMDVKVNDITSPTKEMERLDSQRDAVSNSKNAPSPDIIEENSENAPSAQTDIEEKQQEKAKKRKEKKKIKKAEKGKKAKNKADDTDDTDSEDSEEENKKSKLRENVEFFIPIVLAVIIALLLKTFVFANAVVPTGSMLNTIQEGDRIIASRLAYINDEPERYDIVIFKYPDDESQYFVKRIIGLPGEKVEVIDGIVYVTKTNGETVQLDDSFVTNCVPEGDFGPYYVPEDCYFMMGDNRNSSLDSRFWTNKYVEKDKIVGKVKFRYYPKISSIE